MDKWFRKIRHDAKYINWKEEATQIILTKAEYKEKQIEIHDKCKRIEAANGLKTVRGFWSKQDNVYDEYVPVKKRKKMYQMYVKECGKLYIYATTKSSDSIMNQGKHAFDEVSQSFIERTGLGREAFKMAFGTSPFEWRDCTPPPIYYCNLLKVSRDKEHMRPFIGSAIDGCSQYPTALCGSLPTTDDYVTVTGTIEPDKDYPFALYLNSGHVAIYNEFDTHDWLDLPFVQWLYPRTDTEKRKGLESARHLQQMYYQQFPDEDVTVLMKASKYTFKEEMEKYFAIKESKPHDTHEYKAAKMVLNAFIGMLHISNKEGYQKHAYNHLACVGIARANNNLIKQIKRVPIKDIAHVCVDGIIYCGSQQLGVYERKLGNFEQEFINCEMVMSKTNNYIVKNSAGEVVKFKHGGNDIYKSNGLDIEDNPPIDFEQLFDFGTYNIEGAYDKDSEYRDLLY